MAIGVLLAVLAGLPAAPVARTRAGVMLAAVGDILLDRGVGERIGRFGIEYPFRHVAGILSGADIAFGNLECPLSAEGIKTPKPFSFRADPAAAECLRRAGLDIVSLANNHAMDCGRSGLLETVRHLEGRGIRWCGAGWTRAEAEAATVVTARGLRVGFVGFCRFLPEGGFLRDDRPTIAFASPERVRAAVRAARARADVVVASFHWGVEYRPYPVAEQERLAKEAVDAGAHLVLGHHPHVLQRVEWLGPHAVAAYSLGNFVFDSPRPEARESAILRFRLSRRGVESVDAIPVRVEGCRPRPLPAKEGAAICKRLRLATSEGGHEEVADAEGHSRNQRPGIGNTRLASGAAPLSVLPDAGRFPAREGGRP
ncbi:MAG: CapA family protein, partial [Armatimonadetes bacterium]|nr:CapA family protein [Armatimonadota bacterium]